MECRNLFLNFCTLSNTSRYVMPLWSFFISLVHLCPPLMLLWPGYHYHLLTCSTSDATLVWSNSRCSFMLLWLVIILYSLMHLPLMQVWNFQLCFLYDQFYKLYCDLHLSGLHVWRSGSLNVYAQNFVRYDVILLKLVCN